MDERISWDHLPLYRGLTEHVLVLGAPRSVLVANAAITFIFIMEFHFLYFLIFTVLLHFLCVYISRDDAQFFDCLCQYIKRKNYYST
ncbi:MAG: VirB3 family type IV secretion system protein [Selenomonadaceae bacterium]|nr:VirB3 family type IV secretion system protein [Selenomonadaceae bacterium]